MMDRYLIQILAAAVGSIGFAIILKIKGKQIAYAGLGGMLTWAMYLVFYEILESFFWATLIASIFVAFFAELMARVNKAPSTIFLTAAAVPLIPGRNLYNMMFYIVSEDAVLAGKEGMTAGIIALAIALGFMAVTIIMRYYYQIRHDYIKWRNGSLK